MAGGGSESSSHPGEHKGRAVVVVRSVEEWRGWLRAESETSAAVWVTVWKVAVGPDRLNYEAVVEEALCHGSIDSTVNRFDESSYLLLLAPRKRGSVWSAVNKARIERLLADGRMQPRGQAVIDAAKADGSWTTLDSVEAMEEPDDLTSAIDAAQARAAWDAWAPSRRKEVLYRLVLAKTQATRDKRITETIDALVLP